MVDQRHVVIGGGSVDTVIVGNDKPLALFAGPCVLESKEHAMSMAGALSLLAKKLGIGFVYKTSFDKANRTSISGERGLGIKKGLEILAEVKEEYGCPILTDIHSPEQCQIVAEVADILQIPAFLCRQTDLLIAAGETGKPLNVKKGQFLAPWDMINVVRKIESTGNTNIMLCERGASFGYNTLVSDMRSLPIMRQTGCPVVFDATHSVQQPGGAGASTGGQREFVPTLAKAAAAVGVAAVFMETHEDPENAPSDGPNMVYLEDMPSLVAILQKLDTIAKEYPDVIDVA